MGLERGNTAEEALNVITTLLEKYGQGGPCSELDDSHFYHNSFLIADTNGAWILETSGKLWAAEKVKTGFRNISNGLTIGTTIDKHSEGLLDKAKGMGVWDGQVCISFAFNFITNYNFYTNLYSDSDICTVVGYISNESWFLQGEFNFAQCFSSGGDESRQQEGERLLKEASISSMFDVTDMFNILRHKESHICRGCNDTFPTQGSQVMILT